MGAFAGGDDLGGGLGMEDLGAGMAGGAAMAAARGTPEIPFTTLQVGALLGILLIYALAGIFITDIGRNMWAWNASPTSDLTSGLTQMVIDSAGMK